jgi:hypothetical protein
MFTAAWSSTRARVRVCACVGAHKSVCVFVRMDMQRVAVCWCAPAQRELDAGQAPSSMCLSDSAALSTFTCVSCSLCSSTCMHKKWQIRPITRLACGWIPTTRIVRYVLLVLRRVLSNLIFTHFRTRKKVKLKQNTIWVAPQGSSVGLFPIL